MRGFSPFVSGLVVFHSVPFVLKSVAQKQVNAKQPRQPHLVITLF